MNRLRGKAVITAMTFNRNYGNYHSNNIQRNTITIGTFVNKINSLDERDRVNYSNKIFTSHFSLESRNKLNKFTVDRFFQDVKSPYQEYIKEYNKVMISCLHDEVLDKKSLTYETEI